MQRQLGAKEWQSSPQFRALPANADTCARVGWYQGSAFFLVNGNHSFFFSQTFLAIAPFNKLVG
jgi:hypothetical protein